MKRIVLAFAAALLSTQALAQTQFPASTLWGNVTASTGLPTAIPVPSCPAGALNFTVGMGFGCGVSGGGSSTLPHTHLLVGNGSNIEADFGSLATFSDAGTLSINPTTGTTNRAINTTQVGPSTGSQSVGAGPGYAYNNISVTDNFAFTGGNAANGLIVTLAAGGSNTQGGRVGLNSSTILTAPVNAASTNNFYVGAALAAQANTSAGGTNTGANARGDIVGVNSLCILAAAATNINSCIGVEIDVATATGSTMKDRIGVHLVLDGGNAGGDLVNGSDEGISLRATGGALGWNVGIAFNSTGGAAPPVRSTGTVMGSVSTMAVGSIFDFTSTTCSGNILRVAAIFQVDCNGSVIAGGDVALPTTGRLYWSTRSIISSPADGVVQMTNQVGTGFARLALGGITSAFPSIKRNGAAINFRLGDDSADAAITAAGAAFSGAFGYVSGAGVGGTVTQLTSQSTPVTINKLTGNIQLFSAAGTTAWNGFRVNNTTVAARDTISISQLAGANIYQVVVAAISPGNYFDLWFSSVAGTTVEAPVFQFNIIRGSSN